MLKRLYADNYKSLVNFEINLDGINLFLGQNGSGKSTVFQLLKLLQRFICDGEKLEDIECLSFDSLTRWQTQLIQRFEIEIEDHHGLFRYEASLEYNENDESLKLHRENLFINGNPLLELKSGKEGCTVQLYRDNHSKGPHFPTDWSRSAVGAIPQRNDNMLLTRFKSILEYFIIVQPTPPMMDVTSKKDTRRPSLFMNDFVSWYRHISQDQGLAFKLIGELQAVIPGFDSFKFEAAGEKHRLLKMYFRDEKSNPGVYFYFNELSDGQRMLIVLYTLLFVAKADAASPYVLCIDEPENFMALPEIQPWLTALYDSCLEGDLQAVLISHHPESINYMLASPPMGHWFERQDNGPVRVKKIQVDGDGLEPSELVARGWINGE